MFEFGRDLRKLFAQARETEDLGWVELIGVDLLRNEARRESIDAGRVSCARPFETERRAAALWREHARRSGAADSLERAERAADSLARAAATYDQKALAAVERALTLTLRFDLQGEPRRLDEAERAIQAVGKTHRAWVAMEATAAHAMISARQARLSGDSKQLLDAAALLDRATQAASDKTLPIANELRLERAALSLEVGVLNRDGRLLDQAGRDLSALADRLAPDQRPLGRARVLALCGAGLSALATAAGHPEAHAQGRLMFQAAAEQFTPDHSPLDWVAIQVAQAAHGEVDLMTLIQAEALTEGRGLVLGALVRERRLAREVALALAVGDHAGLDQLETRVLRRLPTSHHAPLDWVADQLGMARLALARRDLGGPEPVALNLILAEAEGVAMEMGAPALAARAAQIRCEAGR
jgi:hypothetical protein